MAVRSDEELDRIFREWLDHEADASPPDPAQRRNPRRRPAAFAAGIVAAAALLVAGGIWANRTPTPRRTAQSSGGACGVVMTFRGVVYHGEGLVGPDEQNVALPAQLTATPLGHGEAPHDCPLPDRGPNGQRSLHAGEVYALAGVSPDVAVAVWGADRGIGMLAAGRCISDGAATFAWLRACITQPLTLGGKMWFASRGVGIPPDRSVPPRVGERAGHRVPVLALQDVPPDRAVALAADPATVFVVQGVCHISETPAPPPATRLADCLRSG